MNSFTPKISIITVVYNGKDLIEGTINSVLNQTYQNIEYTIIDGGSKDGTLEIIKKYESKISKWKSEPDNGLYDAMNKGLKIATGEFVWFMNAGDWIFEKDTIEKMVRKCEKETDVLFGEVMLVNDNRKHLGTRSENTTQKLPKKLNWKSLKKGMVVCHQAFLPRRNLAPLYIENNLAADIHWVIECLKNAKLVTNTQLILAQYLQGGLSKKRHQQSLWDRYDILKAQYGWLANLWNHILIFSRAGIHKIKRIGKPTY
ncbi:MAG: glycosyltransferase [Bacteroidetes bacterium]|jgi:glycosyltransferase involved in cell wall biosynthesis|nr:glycosyltransferase [Bacteroidota bacterium]MDF1866435.1 glycosyltransferase family 2 protein [Saprospiraceae bacterium]